MIKYRILTLSHGKPRVSRLTVLSSNKTMIDFKMPGGDHFSIAMNMMGMVYVFNSGRPYIVFPDERQQACEKIFEEYLQNKCKCLNAELERYTKALNALRG